MRGQGPRRAGAGTVGRKAGCCLEPSSESQDQSKQQEFFIIPKAAHIAGSF